MVWREEQHLFLLKEITLVYMVDLTNFVAVECERTNSNEKI
jgi:hypothetical protein